MSLHTASTARRSVVVAIAIVGLLAVLAPAAVAAPATVNASGPTTAVAGDTVTVSMTITNTGDSTNGFIGNVSLPAGWTVDSQTASGAIWNDGDRAWLWQGIDPGTETTATLTVAVPGNATVGSYNLTTMVKSSERIETTTTHTITVEPATNSTASENSTTPDSGSSETDDRIPGFGIGTALTALTASGLALRRRYAADT